MLAIAGTLLAGPSVVGCKGLSTLKQRCLTGDTASCESACKKGVPGEGGCFHAGNQHREKASLDFAGAEFRRASDYFVRSCDGGYGDGCFLAAELIEAPYAPDPTTWGNALPKMISDDELKHRQKRLEQACARGSARGCRRLGDVLIGKNADRALAAYRKACDAGAAAAECKAARASEVAEAEKWRVACTHGSADDCTRLGELLYQVDPPRGLRLFVAECQLRGVAELVGGEVEFVRARATKGARAFFDAPAAPEGPTQYAFDVLDPVAKGPVALVEMIHSVGGATPELSACIALDSSLKFERIAFELVVDATGDIFRAHASADALSARVARCLEAVFERRSVSKPPGPATVTFTLKVRDVRPAKPD